MPPVDLLEKKLADIVVSMRGHTSPTCKFTFQRINLPAKPSTETAKIDRSKGEEQASATLKWSPPEVSNDNEFDTYTCTVKGDEDHPPDVLQIRVWVGNIKVRAKDGTNQFLQGLRFSVATPGSDATTTTTLADGEWREVPLGSPGVVKVAFERPYQLLQSKRSARTLEATVQLKSEVKIKWPAGAEHVQYVNRDAKQGRDCGHEIEIEVEHDGTGRGDQTYFVKAEFADANSRRNDPKPQIVGGRDAGQGLREFRFEGGRQHRFRVNLGLAGGDVCTIKVGGTKALADPGHTSVKITNWRKLYYQLTCPVDGQRYPKALPHEVTSKLKTELDKAFVVFEQHAANTLDMDTFCGGTPKVAAKIPGEWLVSDGSRDGQHAFLVNCIDSESLAGKVKQFNTLPPDKPGVHILLCDELYRAGETTTKGLNKTLTAVETQIQLNSASGHLFAQELQTPTGGRRGAQYKDPITELKWRPYTPPPPKESEEAEARIAEQHPLVAKHGQKQKLLKGEYVTVPSGLAYKTSDVTVQGFKLTLLESNFGPDLDAIGPKSDATWPIEVIIIYSWVDRTGAAMAYGKLLVCKLPAGDTGRISELVMHELGHAMKQACVPESRAPKDDAPRKSDYSLPPPGVDEHPYSYAGRGHVGPHCHAGLELKDKFAGETGSCVMYGATAATAFCADCLRLLKGTDLRTLKGDT